MSFNLNKLVQPECGSSNPLVAAARQIAMKPAAMTPRFMQPPTTLESHRPQMNFAKEFAHQVHHIATIATTTATPVTTTTKAQPPPPQQQLAGSSSSSASASASASLNHQSQYHQNYMSQLQFNYQQQQQQQPTRQLAGDQLETKYRNEMISQTTPAGLEHVGEGKLDDVQFWQSLSQKYVGPNTYDNIARFKAELTTKRASGSTEQVTEKLEQLTTSDTDLQDYDESQWLPAESLPKLDEMEYVFDERNPLKDQYDDPFSEGLKRLEQGDIPSAALLFEAAVQKQPDNSLAWRYLGTTQAQNEKDNSAIRALRNCLNIDNNDQEARLALSVSLVNEAKHHDACEHLLEWLVNHEKYRSVGASLEEFHQLDEELAHDPFYINSLADKHYNYVRDKLVAAARMSPNNPDSDVQNSLGVLFNIRGEYDKAVDCFKAALSVRSNDSILWNRLGATLANGNKSDEAVIAYRRALEISPGFLRSRYNLAISLIHLNLYEEAAKQLVQILNMQAAGKGDKNIQIRTRSITSTSIWNTLRTVATLLNRPELYPIIDGRDLAQCNSLILKDMGTSD